MVLKYHEIENTTRTKEYENYLVFLSTDNYGFFLGMTNDIEEARKMTDTAIDIIVKYNPRDVKLFETDLINHYPIFFLHDFNKNIYASVSNFTECMAGTGICYIIPIDDKNFSKQLFIHELKYCSGLLDKFWMEYEDWYDDENNNDEDSSDSKFRFLIKMFAN